MENGSWMFILCHIFTGNIFFFFGGGGGGVVPEMEGGGGVGTIAE